MEAVAITIDPNALRLPRGGRGEQVEVAHGALGLPGHRWWLWWLDSACEARNPSMSLTRYTERLEVSSRAGVSREKRCHALRSFITRPVHEPLSAPRRTAVDPLSIHQP